MGGRILSIGDPVGAPDSIAETTLRPRPDHDYWPSPADWRDEIFYSLVIDRFQPGADCVTVGDSRSGDSRHGGNLAGLAGRLAYLEELKVTTILLSPVTVTAPGTYHGYAPVHLLEVDPHLGRLSDLVDLVDRAHGRGMRIILDLVVNHTGPIFEYADGDGWKKDGRRGAVARWNGFSPTELAKAEHFTRRGVIENWSSPEQVAFGDFPPNFRRFATERAETQRLLIHIACWWLKETDVDGFRVDAIRHLDRGFLRNLANGVKRYAAGLGKNNPLILGEHSTGDCFDIAGDFTTGINSAYNYPEYRRQNWALHGCAPTRDLEESFRTAYRSLGPALGNVVRFIDNHDVYRFLRAGEPEGLLRMALAFLMFSIGIPLVYYGTEQGFRQSTNRLEPESSAYRASPQNREDMFAEGRYKSESSAGDNFTTMSGTFRWIRRLAEIRGRFTALRRGEQWIRWSDPEGPGLFAFSRIHGSQEVLVVLNTAATDRQADIDVDRHLIRPGDRLVDVLDLSCSVEAYRPEEGGSKVLVWVPAYGARVFIVA